MNHYNVWQLAWSMTDLTMLKHVFLGWKNRGLGDQSIGENELQTWLKPRIDYCRRQCEELELQSALARIDGPFRLVLGRAFGLPTYDELLNQVTVLIESIEAELRYRRFAYVPVELATTLDKMGHDWDAIWKHFPSAKEDSQEAVYCYALGRNTACVFHLMRVAEYGLRALAREMKIKLPRNKQLEWAQWQDVIREINNKIEKIATTRKAGKAKDEALEFYRGSLGQFQGFKDSYRNSVMHTRGKYDRFEAASALSHVHDFMNRLSVKIDEYGKRQK